MKRRRRGDFDPHVTPEGADFDELQDLGFKLDPPDDTYSDQPDSSSTIGGRRGEQEYGIKGGAADEYVTHDLSLDDIIPDVDVPYDEDALDENDESEMPTMSEWSAEHAVKDEEYISDEHAPLEEEAESLVKGKERGKREERKKKPG